MSSSGIMDGGEHQPMSRLIPLFTERPGQQANPLDDLLRFSTIFLGGVTLIGVHIHHASFFRDHLGQFQRLFLLAALGSGGLAFFVRIRFQLADRLALDLFQNWWRFLRNLS